MLAARRRFQHLSRLLGRTREELDEQVDDDLVLVVVVEAHVGEEFARSVVAEGGVAARVLTNVLWYWPLFALIIAADRAADHKAFAAWDDAFVAGGIVTLVITIGTSQRSELRAK